MTSEPMYEREKYYKRRKKKESPDYPDDPRELARAIFRAGDAKRREEKRRAKRR